MKDITFKVAPAGTGKTKWLLEAAHKYSRHHKIYLVTNSSQEYSKFCDKYFALFQEVCPVNRYDFGIADPNAVILIDNIFSQNNAVSNVEFMQRNCYKMFITVEGNTSEIGNPYPEEELYQQLSLFDQEVTA